MLCGCCGLPVGNAKRECLAAPPGDGEQEVSTLAGALGVGS